MELPDYIIYLVKKGINVSMEFQEEHITYNLETGMKSWAYLSVREEGIHIAMRYNKRVVLQPLEDVEDTVKAIAEVVYDCMQGRTYANTKWLELFHDFYI